MTPTPHPSPSSLREAHQTTQYRTTTLILRQGLPLPLTNLTPPTTLTLHAPHPTSTQPPTPIPLSPTPTPTTFHLQPPSTPTQPHTLHVPLEAPPGLYTLEDSTNTPPLPFLILFNPYHPQSPFHLPPSESIPEYLQASSGRVYVGNHTSPASVPWNYSPFHPVVPLVALHLIHTLPLHRRSSPVHVLRHLSAMLNSQDDGGVLVGNWSGDYSHGTHPSAWTGSLRILRQFWDHLQPVKYAQCWVYACVFTSLLRALGIPAMPVTNFESAHESTKPYNRVVEYMYAHDGEMVERLNRGSVWNFHVWTMAWARRDDLTAVMEEHGVDYHGWQVVDGTPQEMSAGVFRVGPAPVAAVKRGWEVKYDADFIIGEVNADLVRYWEQEEGTGKYVPWRRERRTIGKKLSVKMVGRDERRDVTGWYKFEEGSEEERRAFFNRPSHAVEVEEGVWDVSFGMWAPGEVQVGQDVEFAVVAESGVEGELEVRFRCVYGVTDYTGRMVERLGSIVEDVVVRENGQQVKRLVVTAAEYEKVLAVGMSTILFKCSAKVKGSGQRWAEEALVRVDVDGVLEVHAPSEAEVGEEVIVGVKVMNLTQLKLTEVVLLVEGEGLTGTERVEIEDLDVAEEKEVRVRVVPQDVGDRLLVVSLDTAELRDVVKSVHIDVKDPSILWSAAASVRNAWEGLEKDELVELADLHGRFGA